jgi:citrate synthase
MSSCVCVILPPQISTLAALAYHKSTGHTAAHPNQRLSFAENFLYMLDSNGNVNYRWATDRDVCVTSVF